MEKIIGFIQVTFTLTFFIVLPAVTIFAGVLEDKTDWDFEMDIMIPIFLALMSWQTWAIFFGGVIVLKVLSELADR